jgi:response regulator RpfG family c-di-GMP phosphodiesterase
MVMPAPPQQCGYGEQPESQSKVDSFSLLRNVRIAMETPGAILVVDDEPELRKVLQERLTRMGYTVTTAQHGQEALMLMETAEFDLLLSDIHMPRVSGLELLCKVKERFPLLPVVMITGAPSLDVAIDVMKQGAADFITKPFHFAYIEQVLSRLMRERRLLLENMELSKELAQQKQIERLNRALSKKIDELAALYTISETFNAIDEKVDILEQIVSLAAQISEAEQVSLFLLDNEPQGITLHISSHKEQALFGSFPVAKGEALVRRVAEERQAYFRYSGEDGWCLEKEFNPHTTPLLSLMLPIMIRDSVLGVLYLAPKHGRVAYADADIFLLKTLVEKASLRLENNMLYTNLFSQVSDTLRVLVSTLEARDRYTRDHSLRVVQYSLAIAEELGLGQEEKARLQFAGYLHDIGKIGIPDHILLKPGRLTAEEYRIIQTHPVIGESILQPILHDSLERTIIRNHHERFDGKGYPDSLSGADIPLLVRVVSLSDAFDAMTSPRTYRAPLSLEQAISEVHQCSGTQFDPEIAQIFLRCLPRLWAPPS